MGNLDITKLLATKEDLHSDLAPYFEELGGFYAVRHPLVYSVPHNEALNAFVNAQYLMRKQQVQDDLAIGKWLRYVTGHEQPYQLHAFTEIQEELSNKEYWQLLSYLYIACENIHQNYDLWEMVLFSKRLGRSAFMEPNERRALKLLPNVIEVYRGVDTENWKGFSWTTDIVKATWFAQRFLPHKKTTARIVTGNVLKSQVIGHILSRSEDEIVCHHDDVFNIKVNVL